MWKRRLKGWLFICIICMLVLFWRLMDIQLFSTKAFSKHSINLVEESVKQRTQELVINEGRGSFFDKNGELLTQKKASVLVLFPFLKKMNWNSIKISQITGIPNAHLKKAVKDAKKPFIYGGEQKPFDLTDLQVNQINSLNIPGVFAIEKNVEHSTIPAEQLIGLVGENAKELKIRYPDKKLSEKTMVGVSGLERSFDEFLLPDGKSKLIYHVDGKGAPLFGGNVRYIDPANPFYPVNIRTTIDKRIQQKAETLVDKYSIKKGGLVLVDINNSSILAMVSRPKVDKKNPYNGDGINNRMVNQQIIGSVFKTVVAAAAIENNMDSPLRLFNCSKKINGERDIKYDYGMLNFTDSYARSCNYTFSELAKELMKKDQGILEKFAKKLTIFGSVGWQGDVYHTSHFKQLSDEENGRVFLSDIAKKDPHYVGMTGIGQHEVRATPLAVANMMATIARGGRKEMIRAVSKIEYKNGTTMISFNNKDLPGETLSPYTAMKLQKLLREVVVHSNGTGKGLQSVPYEVAGKSGTAETGKYQNGVQLHNKWFAGYFPYHHPKYALVAVKLDVMDEEGGVIPIFADMVKMLYEMDSER